MSTTSTPTAYGKTENWQEFDWVDLQPLPGSFVSTEEKDFRVNGETVRAFTWLHAEYLWLKRQVACSGDEWGQCCHCHHAIRYAVVFEDERGGYHIVGQDCAHFINSRQSRKDFSEKRRLSEMKAIKTKNGERFVLNMGEVPAWYWNLPREERPRFCSTSKMDSRPGSRSRRPVWYLSIWGETPAEVLENWQAFQDLRKQRG